jgi:hypothetical protein
MQDQYKQSPRKRAAFGLFLNHAARLARQSAPAALALFLFAGHAAPCQAGFYDRENGRCAGRYFEQIEFKEIFQDIAREFCPGFCSGCSSLENYCGSGAAQNKASRSVLVADFVDLQNLQSNQTGALMGELMRGSLNRACNYSIVQAEFSKYFKLSDKGLVVLSRDASDLKMDTDTQSESIVGTYSIMNNKLLIFARRINTGSGLISKMVIKEVDFECGDGRWDYTVK